MKKELKQMLFATKVALVILWPTCAWAAAITFGQSMSSIPPLAVLMTIVLSTLSGITALLHAMKQEYEKNAAIARLWLLIASKLFGSNMAGLLMFFFGESLGLDDAKQAMAIIAAAFGGTWFIERVLQSFTNTIAPEPKP